MIMSKERFVQTAHKCSYAEYRCTVCSACAKTGCIHREAYRRLPLADGGLGLCPNLKYAPVIGETGVLVERNLVIKDYRSAQHAVSDLRLLKDTFGYDDLDGIMEQFENGMVYVRSGKE